MNSSPRLARSLRLLALALCGLIGLQGLCWAQQSVQQALDDCIQEEQRTATVKGAALGVLGALGASLLSPRDERRSSGPQITLGSGGGSALGLASAWFRAVGRCYVRNPSWIPESQLQRGASDAALRAELAYRPEAGPLAQMRGIDMPSQVRAGDSLEIRSRFVVLTPHGEEATVQIERRLFALADGKEQALPFTGHARETRVLASGESLDLGRLPIPKDVPVGVVYRFEFSIAVAGLESSQPSTLSASVRVE